MKSIRFCLAAVAFMLLFASVCLASEGKTEYLYKLKPMKSFPVAVLSRARLQEETTLSTELGIYKTTDLELLKEYSEMGILEFYEEDCYATLQALPKTANFQSSLGSGVPLGVSYDQIGINSLWSMGLTGEGLKIGVVDSGLNAHNDIKENILDGYNYVDGNTDVSDPIGHGTVVSGLIAANGKRYKGVAYNAKIVPLRAFMDDGTALLSTLATAIYEAVTVYDCDIVNMSFGFNKDTLYTVKHVIDTIYRNPSYSGVVLVAAAGNITGGSSGSYDKDIFPGSYSEVISVANLRRDDTLSGSSCENNGVDVAAPGTSISGLSYKNLSGYTSSSGTSFACPMVVGVCALVKQACPSLTYSDVKSLLCNTATDLGTLGKDFSFGYGKVSGEKIVSLLYEGILYASPDVVENDGEYSIVVRNGVEDMPTDATLVFASYDKDGKMTSIDLKSSMPLYGKTHELTVKRAGKLKLFTLWGSNYEQDGAPIEYSVSED